MGRPARAGQAPQRASTTNCGAGAIQLLVVDEIGYIPFDPQAANLMFTLVAAATNAARSSSPATAVQAWGEIFGDAMVAAAMIDRLVHHADILSINGTQAHIA